MVVSQDAPGNRQRELHHLLLGLPNHGAAERSELVERLGKPAQHGFGALVSRFEAGALAGGVAAGEGLTFEGGQVDLVRAADLIE
jgi:hypothetical protein